MQSCEETGENDDEPELSTLSTQRSVFPIQLCNLLAELRKALSHKIQ